MKKTIAALFALLAFGAQAQAQDYPTKPITMIVAFPPGGVAELVGRPLAASMEKTLGQPVIILNRPGAGGAIGTTAAAKAAPDGYTILMTLSSISIFPVSDPLEGKPAPYQISDFMPIALVTADPTVLVVRADAPWKTLAEFVADARRQPGRYNFGSSGNYGTMHVPMEMLKQASKTFMVHVPYTGAGPAVVGLLGGQVDALATGPATIVQHVKAGKLRALAHWGQGRLGSLPDVPSLAELGYKVEFSQWAGLFVPAGTPEPVIAKLRDAAKKTAEDERVIRTIGTAGTPIQYLDAPQFARFVQDDAATMAGVVRRIGKQ